MLETVALRVLIVATSFVVMEAVAALVHRHWMHGMGWIWHRSHHARGEEGGWQRNDLYALVFGAAAIALFTVGQGRWWPLYWVATGMTLYGLVYAVVHDGLVHRRGLGRWRWIPRGTYLARLVQAHRLHHAVHEREGGVSFGFLYAQSPDRLARQLRAQRLDAAAPAEPEREVADLRMGRTRQAAVGMGGAALVVLAWCGATGYALWLHRFDGWGVVFVPLLVALITWLNVGLFIVAHDAMHGSLHPTKRFWNRAVGHVCMLLYGGFQLHRFELAHRAHHAQPGSAGDPDFHLEGRRFWPWYGAFMRRYVGWRELAGPALIVVLLVPVLGVPWGHVALFWALPALLSSVQLFAFGTWLPHRHADDGFVDAHRARSSGYGTLLSLLTCFHFGYHLEHHLWPDVPWWRLPALRRARSAAQLRGAVTPVDVSTAAPGSPEALPDLPPSAGSARR